METKRSNKTLAVVAAILLVGGIGAAAFALTRPNTNEDTRSNSPTAEEMGMTDEEHANMDMKDDVGTSEQYVITFTDDGFDKDTYTFPADKAITVKNESSMDMQFSSDDHPTHRDHTELNMKLLSAGETGTFTPPGKGTYAFHDHINDQFEGTLIIE